MIGSVIDRLRAIARPACVVGKGPSFDRYRGRPHNCLVIGINEAAVLAAADLAFVTDVEVLTDQFFDRLPPGAVLVLPYYPHYKFAPLPNMPVTALVATEPRLAALAGKGQLDAYRSDRCPKSWPAPDWPRVRVRGFTGVAVMHCLQAAGKRQAYAAGLDGGSSYHAVFSHLKPLTNGQKSYKIQATEFAMLERSGFKITRL